MHDNNSCKSFLLGLYLKRDLPIMGSEANHWP